MAQGDVGGLLVRLVEGEARCLETFKDDARSLVRLLELEGRRWVVKRYRGSPWKTATHHLVGRTPAWREWRNAQRLRRCGVRVIDLLALIHDDHFGRWSQSLVTPYVAAPNLQQWIHHRPGCPGSGPRRAVAAAVGAQLGVIGAAGYVNRDHKVSNLLVDRACAQGAAGPLILDPARLKRRTTDRVVFKTLALLAWTARRAGAVNLREQFTCLRAVLAADPRLARGRPQRLRHAASEIQIFLDDFQRRAEARRPAPPVAEPGPLTR